MLVLPPLASVRTRLASARHARLLPIALLLTACATVAPPAPAPAPQMPQAPQPTTSSRPAAAPPVSKAEEDALRSLVTLQERLYRVAGPLLVNNPPLCKSNARNLLGFTAKNKYSYSSEYVNAAQSLYGLDERLQVLGVLTGSGAARAGIRRGDILVSVEDQPMPQGENAERQAAAILAPLVTARSNVRLTVMRGGSNVSTTVPLTPACAFGIELGNADTVMAYSDGHRVLVTRGMLEFIRTDEELAYVMAKEMAHNALAHANRQQTSATIGGIIDNLVRIRPDLSTMVGMAGIRPMPSDLDVAADRLSLYLLARAGYNIDNTVPFWRRLAAQYPATMPYTYTALHPDVQKRLGAMERTVADIRTKKATNKALVP
jgi:membrane-associated protease RseP (regulator of RpoE activity)